jgi:hypothetical protein
LAFVIAACSDDAAIAPDPETDGGVTGPSSGDASDDRPAPLPNDDGGAPPDGGASLPTPAAVLAKLATCANELTNGRYKADSSGTGPADIPVCGAKNAVFFRADMDIDCDGKATTECNKTTDPAFQPQTAATDSKGAPLDAAALPYVVVPGASTRWDYRASGLRMGSVVLVLYGGKMAFGILGDVGPTTGIGEASVAMAKALGIDPNPRSGGVDAETVTYLAFTGPTGVVTKNESHEEAVSVGTKRLAQFMNEN